MNPILKARLEREHEEKEKLFDNITYGNLPLPVRKMIFDKAWELGHSSGPNEVEMYYNDLTELQEQIQTWYKEYKEYDHTCKQIEKEGFFDLMEKASRLWKGSD